MRGASWRQRRRRCLGTRGNNTKLTMHNGTLILAILDDLADGVADEATPAARQILEIHCRKALQRVMHPRAVAPAQESPESRVQRPEPAKEMDRLDANWASKIQPLINANER